MNSQKGITLITLVATIIILLILAAVSITLIIGPDGMIERSKASKLDSRYASVIDKTKLREADLKMSQEREEDGEHQKLFVERLIREGLIDPDEDYISEDYKTISLGKISENDYKYTINIAEARTKNSIVSDLIDSLPVVTETENNDMRYLTIIMKTFSSNETVTLPISNTTNLTINWDADKGNIFNNPNKSANPTYTYAQAGEYKVQIKGQAQPGTSFGGEINRESIFSYYFNPHMHALIYWGENGFTKFNSMSFAFTNGIPIPSKESFKNATHFTNTFSARTYQIPSKLNEKKHYANFMNFDEDVRFENCSYDLLDDGYDTGAFQNTKINVPENLFINATKVVDFGGLFYESEDLILNIPENLFINCPRVTSFEKVFYRTRLNSVPEKIFANNTKATNFAWALSGTGINSVPEKLFANNPLATNFEGIFNHTGISEIPENLFVNNKMVTNFGYAFSYAKNLVVVPENIFANNKMVTDFSWTFFECSSLVTIPENLFSKNTEVRSFNTTFSRCSNLTTNPENLFNNNLKVTDFYNTFFSCRNLTGKAPELWTRSNINNSSHCFFWCDSLTNYNDIPKGWK